LRFVRLLPIDFNSCGVQREEIFIFANYIGYMKLNKLYELEAGNFEKIIKFLLTDFMSLN